MSAVKRIDFDAALNSANNHFRCEITPAQAEEVAAGM
jgi:hypothetical protein